MVSCPDTMAIYDHCLLVRDGIKISLIKMIVTYEFS